MIANHSLASWVGFHALIAGLLAFDLGISGRSQHVIKMREALLWSVFWIALGVGFGGYVWWLNGARPGIEYLTGYIVEKSLSVDNLFVFLIIFQSMGIKRQHQRRLLFWGIVGAIILRGLMIAAGSQLLERFQWLAYVFGVFLIFTGIKFFRGGEHKMEPKKSPIFKLAKRYLPLSTLPAGKNFTLKEGSRRLVTLTFVALLMIESSDVIFALDSVPAVFGVTRDPYIVYTSNIFAILGLRSLFFVLEDLLYRFHHLKIGLAFVLVFVGAKMCLEHWYPVGPGVSLLVIGVFLGASVITSLIWPPRQGHGDS